jgi:hypothetical protein
MADLSKLKRKRSSLGAPPPVEEASPNLEAPETAPTHVQSEQFRIDGRSLRRTNRTIQFATRVTPEFDTRLRQIAARDGLMLVEVLERALDAYESR